MKLLRIRWRVHGFSYTTASDAVEILRKLIVDEGRVVANNAGYLHVFSEEEFNRNFIKPVAKERITISSFPRWPKY